MVLVVAWLGKGDVDFWNEVGENLARKGLQICFLAYSRGANLGGIRFPFVDVSSFGASVHHSNADTEGAGDMLHVEATWRMTKSMLNVSLVIVWNGLHGVWRAWNNLVKREKFPHFIIEKGGFPDCYQIDKTGINGLSEYSNMTIDELRVESLDIGQGMRISEYLAGIQRSHNDTSSKSSGESLKAKLNIPLDRKIVVFFGAWDVAAGIQSEQFGLLQSPHFEGSHDALLEVQKVLESRSDSVLLYKLHPCDAAGKNLDKLLWHGSIDVGKCNAIDLIELSDVVCGLQSSLLYMACALGKPILLLGKTVLSGKGIAFELGEEGKESLDLIVQQALAQEGWEKREYNKEFFINWYISSFCYTKDEALKAMGGQGAAELAAVFGEELCLNKQPNVNQVDTWRECMGLWARSKKEWSGKYEARWALDDIKRARQSPLGRILVLLKSVSGFRALGRALSHVE